MSKTREEPPPPPDGIESPSSDHREARLAKLDALKGSGVDAYKLGFERSHQIDKVLQAHADLAPETETQEQVRIAGRLLTLRRHGKIAFADLRDQSGQIQLFARAELLDAGFEAFTQLDLGDWVGAWGRVVTTRKGELSVLVEGFEILSKSLRPLPEKFHGLKDVEMRYRQRYLDLIANPEAMQLLTARSGTVAAIRSWLEGRGFIEVETPILQPIPGGALAKPFKTFHETLGIDLYLRIAPELYLKRLVVGGVEKVFEINRNFRNEGVSVSHNPEFTMLELYEAFGDYNSMAVLLEEMCCAVATQVMGSTDVTWGDSTISLKPPFRRARLIDLVEEAGTATDGDLKHECERLGVPFDPKWSWGKLLLEIYEKTVEPNLMQPTFVMDYPLDCSPLAREHRSDPRFTEHLDLVIAGMEIGVAYSELTDPIEQRKRFEDQAVAREAGDDDAHRVDEDFLRALEYGMPPTGGLGFGIDRFVMVLTGQTSIREVILFPSMRPEVL